MELNKLGNPYDIHSEHLSTWFACSDAEIATEIEVRRTLNVHEIPGELIYV